MSYRLFPRLLALLLAVLPVLSASAKPAWIANPAGFEVHRGVNLSHWLSQRFEGYDPATYITERDFAYIRSIGYDHVRIPIDEVEFWNDRGEPIEEAFSYLEKALAWSKAHDLRVVIDLHTVRTHHFNAENEGGKNSLFTDPKAQDAMLDLWRQLSARLKKYPVDQVAYEIMNEPVADDPQDWNRLVAKAAKLLRELEPSRVLIIGANRWQQAASFPFLVVPEGDRNLILSVHTYEPLAFTHYTAGWVPSGVYRGPVQYPGVVVKPEDAKRASLSPAVFEMMKSTEAFEHWDRARLAETLRPAFEKARALNLQLYCGEFGCLPTVPRKDRLAYYRDIVGILEENGVAWANWEYKAEFGIKQYDTKTGQESAPDEELISILVGRK